MYCDYKYNSIDRSTNIKVSATVYCGDYVDTVYVRSGVLTEEVFIKFDLGTSQAEIDAAFNQLLKTYEGYIPIHQQT